MQNVASEEGIPAPELLALVASGKVIIPHNPRHAYARPIGIGHKLRTKVDVNLGISADFPDLEPELEKLRVSLKYETDTIVDLSTRADVNAIRCRILKEATVPLGTVPICQAVLETIDCRGTIVNMPGDDLFSAIEAQAE